MPNALRELLTPEEEDTQVKDPKEGTQVKDTKNVQQSEGESSTEKKGENQENKDEN